MGEIRLLKTDQIQGQIDAGFAILESGVWQEDNYHSIVRLCETGFRNGVVMRNINMSRALLILVEVIHDYYL